MKSERKKESGCSKKRINERHNSIELCFGLAELVEVQSYWGYQKTIISDQDT